MTFKPKMYAFLFSACLLLNAAMSAQNFTIEQAMSAPYNSQLTAAPTNDAFAWTSNSRGRRNLWAATRDAAGKYASVQLTKYSDDDGLEIGDIAWMPDGSSILYVRGGDLEFPSHEAPNPALLPGGVDQEIWIVGIHGDEPRKITAGRSPAVSTDSGKLAFLLKNQIWTVSWKDPGAKPEQLLHTRGTPSSLQWSPDGRMLAFVSSRDDHSFIGVYDFAAKSLRYVDPGTDHDRDFSWSPDSASIAFIRVPFNKKESIFGPMRTGQPWSIRIADPHTGAGHEIWRAKEGMGSVFHPLPVDEQLYWTNSKTLIFPWEGDGWQHMYSVPLTGGEAKLFTPGEFEVDNVTKSKDHAEIIYSSNQYSSNQYFSNQEDIDRKHIWKLDTATGQVSQLTHGEGIETSPAISSDGKSIVVLRSDARIPIRPALLSADGSLEDLAPQTIPSDFPAASFVVPQQVIFSAADGMQIHGQLFLPHVANDGKPHPAIVFFHGGSRRQMVLGWNPMEYYSNAYAMNQYLASLGYIVLSVNYRSGIGYGQAFREALNYGPTGASEYNDVIGAGLYLRSRPDVDGGKIGAWGGSYGGYLTALALARASDLFAAGVDFHGVHDWNLELGNWLPAYDPAADPEAARVAWNSSPLASMSTWRSPVLLIQGDDDRNVQFSQTVQLAEALRKQKVEFDELVFPDEIHDFLLHKNWIAAYKAGGEYFQRHLK